MATSLKKQRALIAKAQRDESASALVHMLAKLHLLRGKPQNTIRLLEELQASRGERVAPLRTGVEGGAQSATVESSAAGDAAAAVKEPYGLSLDMAVTNALALLARSPSAAASSSSSSAASSAAAVSTSSSASFLADGVLAVVERLAAFPPASAAETTVALAMIDDGVLNLDAGICGFAARRRRLYSDGKQSSWGGYVALKR